MQARIVKKDDQFRLVVTADTGDAIVLLELLHDALQKTPTIIKFIYDEKSGKPIALEISAENPVTGKEQEPEQDANKE